MSDERQPLLGNSPIYNQNSAFGHQTAYNSNALRVPIAIHPSQHTYRDGTIHQQHTSVPYSDSQSDLGEKGCDFEIKPDSVHVPQSSNVSNAYFIILIVKFIIIIIFYLFV